MQITKKTENKCFAGSQAVYQHNSIVTRCEMAFSVYIPQIAWTHKRPAIIYLSGLTCTHENVTTKAGFQRYAQELGLIIVCPDTSPRGTNFPEEHDSYDFGSGAGFYLNATQKPWSANYRMYDYISKELPDIISHNFPVVTPHFGLMGHSMGGHGALTIGLRNPDIFPSVSAFSPIVAPSQCPWGQKAFTGYLGDDHNEWQRYDATELMKNGCKSPSKILIDQGTSDEFLEEQLKPDLFLKACREKGQDIELRMQEGYDHSYYFISSFIGDHLLFHEDNLAAQ
ncbi:S-formylglutathione hydrolase [Aliikangiella marina]|uniref:S-formylglutathione hydrolase n=1 Tax=Aliikangiella marina TaxID=1712262 RepID=A0A545TD23_9GAMM|nr:S-formylglutathione hydrolase [Aliikangiella marina]TQV75091.1 S-formylglutathione hydrolase [Aliikangiella marina]